ncbi:MAG TPA: RNA polymerase sigma factor [Candidatus Dormibacteraeota bacterium]
MSAAPGPDRVRDARAGNRVAFEELLRPAIDPGYRLACALLQNADAAQDAVQEAAVKAWRKIERLDPNREFKPWFLGIVANQCRSISRARWSSVIGLGQHASSEPAVDDAVIGRHDLRAALASRLTHPERVLVVGHYFLDLPLAELAAMTGKSQAATRSKLYRALHRLRPDLEINEEPA